MPILIENGAAIAGISLSVPAMRLSDQRRQQRVVAALKRAAGTIEAALRK